MKPLKVHVGDKVPSSNWLHIKSFADFNSLLNTVNMADIELLHFGSLDAEDGDDPMGFSEVDCAYELVSRGRGKPLPQCLVDKESDVTRIINHYIVSYKYDNFCAKIK